MSIGRRLPTVFFLGAASFLGGALTSGCAGAGTATATDGARLFARNCAGCHGISGRADGIAARFLYPRPRDFSRSQFRFGDTLADIERTVSRGLPGTSMPPFEGLLSADQIASLARHVASLSPNMAAGEKLSLPPLPDGSAHRGRELYADACRNCHGAEGRGDGPSSRTMADDVGIPLRPVDLTSAPLKGGDTPDDIHRVLLRGVPGTPMPSYDGALTPQQMADMVAFVRSLRPQHEAMPGDNRLLAARHPSLPPVDDVAAWDGVPAISIALRPLWQRPGWPPRLTVRTLHDDRTVRFLLEWPDDHPDRTVGRVDDFVDAVALMLPSRTDGVAFIGMGSGVGPEDPGATVHIWQWRATQGAGPAQAYPRLVRDANPLEALPRAFPARVAENPLSGPAGKTGQVPAVLEYTAAGPGSVTIVPAAARRGDGTGVWQDGHWRVALDLPMTGGEPDLSDGTTTLAALAVWDGAAGDRNGQKTITPWVRLEIAP
ncbi:MAG: c-type cytochrome [Acidobacteriota bacterium]